MSGLFMEGYEKLKRECMIRSVASMSSSETGLNIFINIASLGKILSRETGTFYSELSASYPFQPGYGHAGGHILQRTQRRFKVRLKP